MAKGLKKFSKKNSNKGFSTKVPTGCALLQGSKGPKGNQIIKEFPNASGIWMTFECLLQ